MTANQKAELAVSAYWRKNQETGRAYPGVEIEMTGQPQSLICSWDPIPDSELKFIASQLREAADTLDPPWSDPDVDVMWTRRNRHRDQGRGLT